VSLYCGNPENGNGLPLLDGSASTPAKSHHSAMNPQGEKPLLGKGLRLNGPGEFWPLHSRF
jgi:hypothetical protein